MVCFRGMKDSGKRPTPGEAPGRSENRADLEQRAEELGIDLGLLEENLKLTPLERMRQHDRNLRQILAVRARLGIDDPPAAPPPTPPRNP